MSSKILQEFCKKSCKILQEILQDLARNPARSCKTSSKILHKNIAPAYARILHFKTILQDFKWKNLARLARKWPNYVQDCKISASLARLVARFSIILEQDLQQDLASFFYMGSTVSAMRSPNRRLLRLGPPD